MSNINTPIFPFLESQQHYSDYGFDPQIDYFQVLEEARKHKKESFPRSKGLIETTTHFKLQKPTISSKEDFSSKKIKKSKKRWWKNTLHFFKGKWPAARFISSSHRRDGTAAVCHDYSGSGPLNRSGAACVFSRGSMSGPVYITESRSGSSTPSYLTANRPSSGPLAGTLTPAGKSDLQIPYISLREINMDQRRTTSAPAMPIYLVT